jgi:DNA end-binding protein Ku
VEVPGEEVVRGYEHHDHLVVLTEEELETLALKGEHTVELFQCVGADEVDPVYFDKAYYLQPEVGGRNAYVLLREALARTGKVAMGAIVLREKQHLALVRPCQGALVLHTLFYPVEVQSLARLALSHVSPRERELKATEELVQKLSGGFAPERFTDHYRSALTDLLEQKEKEGKSTAKPRRQQKPAILPPRKAASGIGKGSMPLPEHSQAES